MNTPTSPTKRPAEFWIQERLFWLTSERGPKFLRVFLLALGFALLAFIYNQRAYRNMATPDAMDSAQLARNIASGKGFTTRFIRPLGIYLYTNAHPERLAPSSTNQSAYDPAALKSGHPDMANPPLYPLLLAGWMKIFPAYYPIPEANPDDTSKKTHWFWTRGGSFAIYPPDFAITVLNQILLGIVILLSYKLAARLFDPSVGTLTALLVAGSEVLWRFSTSGLSTMLLVIIFLGLVHLLVSFERVCRDSINQKQQMLLYPIGLGIILGLGTLTRYSFGWLLLPVAIYVGAIAPRIKPHVISLLVVSFLVTICPWVIRTWSISGVPFGVATYQVLFNSPIFPGYSLERSLSPDFTQVSPPLFWRKLFQNMRTVTNTEFLNIAGSWVSAFWIVALFLRYRSSAISKFRFFIIGTVPLLLIVQCLIRSQQSEDFPVINSENLIVLLTPIVAMFGAALFNDLAERIIMETPWDTTTLRRILKGAFIVAMCIPFLNSFAPPLPHPTVYPPYYPPLIQRVSNWMKPEELMMSDIPWAVAWYGDRQAIWLTPDPTESFLFVNDYIKPIRGLFLTPKTMDGRFLSDWLRAGDRTWGAMVLEAVVMKRVPAYFPLRHAPEGLLPEHLFLSDWPRWQK